MKQQRIVTIQDISCFGKCSLTVALPILSAMGVETVIVPTAILSTHTGGFKNFTFRDLTEDIKKISDHWTEVGLDFDMIYTGYLGSFEQLASISEFIDNFKSEKTKVVIDPVMGDNGKLYTGFDEAFAKEMAKLAQKADYIIPNLTEASFMLGEEYIEKGYDEEYIFSLLKRLSNLGAKNVILTGVSYSPDKIGAVCYSSETGKYHSYFTDHIGRKYHGTGDIFSSVVAGGLLRSLSVSKAIEFAADFVPECIKSTIDDESHWYGVRFEDCMPYLVERLKKETSF